MSEKKQGKGKSNVSVHSRIQVAEYIGARGDRMGWTRSKMAMGIINWWLAHGAPPVHQAEATQPPLPVTEDVLEGIDLSKIPLQESRHPFPAKKPSGGPVGAGVARNYLAAQK